MNNGCVACGCQLIPLSGSTQRETIILLKYPFSPLRFIKCLVFPLFVTLSCSSSNISSRARAAKHRSIARHFLGKPICICFLRILGRSWTQTSRAQVLNSTCCIRLATSSNNLQHLQQCCIQQCWMMLDPFGRAFNVAWKVATNFSAEYN